MIRRSSVPILALLAACTAIAFAAHSKPRSIEPVDAAFHATDPGTIEASINPPIQGVLRIVVQARTSGPRSLPNSAAGPQSPEGADHPFTLEVTQSDRPIPFRLVSPSGRHNPGSGHSLLVAEIDVNDLTPGLPVSVRFHSNLDDSADLQGAAYQVVY